MNYTTFLKNSPLKTLAIAIAISPFILLHASFAQDANVPMATKSQLLSPDELSKINNAPISQTVKVQNRVEGKSPRELAFDYQEENGTKIREYREKDQAREIEVESGMGTHYQMSAPIRSTPSSASQTIDRVPSVQLPF